MKTTRIMSLGLGLGLAALLGLATGAQAQGAYPNKPVRLISDSAPGSSNDVTIRILAEHFGQLWGQQVQVLNHPGAGGGISARIASQAEPDGYTFYVPAASAFLALKGAAPEMRDKVFRNMSTRAAETLREDLEGRGPVRVSDVEAEQKQILKIVRRLVEEGQIVIASGGADEFL